LLFCFSSSSSDFPFREAFVDTTFATSKKKDLSFVELFRFYTIIYNTASFLTNTWFGRASDFEFFLQGMMRWYFLEA